MAHLLCSPSTCLCFLSHQHSQVNTSMHLTLQSPSSPNQPRSQLPLHHGVSFIPASSSFCYCPGELYIITEHYNLFTATMSLIMLQFSVIKLPTILHYEAPAGHKTPATFSTCSEGAVANIQLDCTKWRNRVIYTLRGRSFKALLWKCSRIQPLEAQGCKSDECYTQR